MIPELGHFALIIAFAIALVQSVVPLIGAAKNDAAMIAIARPAALAQFLFVGIAYAALTHAFIVFDFSLLLNCSYLIFCNYRQAMFEQIYKPYCGILSRNASRSNHHSSTGTIAPSTNDNLGRKTSGSSSSKRSIHSVKPS